jgi:radical SAM protein with 4Fe4S-binding SPASM domain
MKVPRRIDTSGTNYRPVYVVWELTLRCDQPCTHCGSRAGDARESEVSTAEAIEVVQQLKAMGTEEIAVIGGEAYLHPGFLDIVRSIKAAGIRPTMTTGGRSIDRELAQAMGKAGFFSVSVSVDGLEATHDLMRASKGSFAAATGALRSLKAAGIRITANTNFNRLNERDLEPLYELLRDIGIEGWQVQITTPLGRAADRPDMILQPWDLLDLVPRIAAIKQQAYRDRILLSAGNNLGYFGPEEALLRSVSPDGSDHWQGCNAGKYVMGIESDGAVKGCPSLQTSHYVGGNLREKTIRDIWDATPELGFTRGRTVDSLWGYCRSCAFAETCLGGCSFTAHAILGRPGNNPYCHYRARQMAKQGKRERLVPVAAAPGKPFDNGQFTLVQEPLDAPDDRLPQRAMAKTRRHHGGVSLPVLG